ncbi:hypothetical protein AXF42_Ash011205 [Apostasia shenzhenica]|uniref:C2 domain-containing protein n=1 Tax=Apostasia shenzhenica TaxID=1088818 RepID=A0A2I0AL86_9ASPA|nr:hypothetical protein AXF42_Ash011205 [Apostasia shenzhenica]
MDSQLVEINLISAQGLKAPPGHRQTKAYAVAWIDPAAKLRTSVDREGGENPSWNEKFVFRVPSSLLRDDSSSAVSVEIYSAGGWYLPDSLVGAVRLLLANLRLLVLPPDSPAFVALGIRRPSGRFHGILNVGAAVLSRVPIIVAEALTGTPAVGYRDLIGGEGSRPRQPLWRSASTKRTSPPLSPAATDRTLKEINNKEFNGDFGEVRETKGDESDCNGAGDGGLAALCGLGFTRKIHASPSDQNFQIS